MTNRRRPLVRAARWLRGHHRPHPLSAALVAGVLPFLALAITAPLFGDERTPPFFLFTLPVAIAAWFAGLRYGVASLGVSIATLFFAHTAGYVQWETREPTAVLRLLGWAFVALVIVTLLSLLRVAYRELWETSERFRLAQESARVWSWELNPQTGGIMWSSPQAEVLHRGQLSSLFDRVHPGDRQSVERALESALRERTGFALEFRVLTPENEVHWVLCRGVVFESAGRPVRVVGVNADITARKRAEQAEVEAATGQLAANLAHQINNPLEMLISSLYLLEASCSPQEESRVYLAAAREGAARVSQLVRELLRLYPRRQH